MTTNNKIRFRINFESKWLGAAAFFGGLGFFLLCVYYLGFVNLFRTNILETIFYMLLPMIAMGGTVIILHVMRYNSAQLVIAAAGIYSILMLLRSFSYDGIVWIIIGVVWYLATALICLLTLTGGIREKRIMAIALIVPAVFRIAIVDWFQYVFKLSFVSYIQELAMLAGLACFGVSALCFEPLQSKRKGE